MANPLIFIVAVVIVAVVLFFIYTSFLTKAITKTAVVISLSTSTPVVPHQSNKTTNSIANAMIVNTERITIYENDFNGINIDHHFSPSVFNVTASDHVSLYVVNNGIIPHSLRIFGPNFNASVQGDLLPGQNAIINFTAPPLGDYSMISTHPGDQALGFNGLMRSTG
jgi:hypothetical protein